MNGMADIFTDGPVFEEDQGTVPEPVAPAGSTAVLHGTVRISRTLWLIKLTLLAVPDTAGQELVREWKKFRTLVQ